MTSIRKESFSTSASEVEIAAPAPASAAPAQAQPCPDKWVHYPASAPHRCFYLAARFISVASGLILTALSTAAFVLPPQQKTWFSPILNPALACLFPSAIDAFLILRCNRRAPPGQRLLHDGILALGTCVALGFVVSFSLPAITDGVEPSATLAKLIWFFMINLIFVHASIAVGGCRDTIVLFRSRRQASSNPSSNC